MTERIVRSGPGWRVGWHPQAEVFKGLVGAEDWALELTEAELDDVCRLSRQLADTMKAMVSELMDEEKIACELETDLVWLEAEGYPQAYSLHVMLLTGRRGEGFWAADAVPELLQALMLLKVF